MSRRTTVPTARRFRKGQLSTAELVAMAKQFANEQVRAELLEQVEAMDDYSTDALLVEGDLTLDGDLDTGDTGDQDDGDAEGTLLVVRGDLTVRGLYRDACNDAPDRVLVLGDLKAENMITAAHLEVRGNVVVSGVIVGDYNDGRATIDGDLSARLFAPAGHAFTVRGGVRAEYFVGGSNELTATVQPKPVAWKDVPLAPFDVDNPEASKIIKRLKAHARVLS